MKVLKLRVEKLDAASAARFEAAAMNAAGVIRVDTWPGRAEITIGEGAGQKVMEALAAAGFASHAPPEKKEKNVVRISGMTCRSCEITVERRFKSIDGIASVDVDAAKGTATIVSDGPVPSLRTLQAAIEEEGYVVKGMGAADAPKRAAPLEVAGLFAAVFMLGGILSKLGVMDGAYEVGSATNFAAAALLGLVAGSSSCMAVSGGLLLSSAAAYRERYGGGSAATHMRPVALFVAGRIISYGTLGAVIGLIGSALTPSPLVTGAITVAAAVYMIVMGLDMIGWAPAWLKGLMPRMPKRFAHLAIDAQGRPHPAMPMLLGGATFFIPCGFTQALQFYALAAGSPALGASILAGFAIGSAPALLALGWASASLKGRAGTLFFRFSGALVVVLGLWNVQNGFVVAGHPLSLPDVRIGPTTAAVATAGSDPNVAVEDGVQVIDLRLTVQSPFYEPGNRFTVKAGMPVKMILRGYGTGCRSIFQIPKAGVRTALDKPVNVVEFTPKSAGEYAFSCSMGMFPGSLTVVKG